MKYIFLKELNNYLSSLIAYVVIIVFLILNGLFFWVLPNFNLFETGSAEMGTLFFLAPWVLLFLIPAVTMRSFAEEKKNGTLELLITKPLSGLSIILGKYFACLVLFLIALTPTALYYLSIFWLGNPVGNIDSAMVAGSYCGLILLGAVFSSIGIYSSSLTENQIVSFILTVVLCLLFYILFDQIAVLFIWSGWDYWLKQLGISAHYESISRGVIDSRDLIYFLSIIVLMLGMALNSLEKRK